jgi:CheY-like chemotaxis protein
VRRCANALEALRACDQTTFDVIVTDLRMPGMNGMEFVRVLEQRSCDSQSHSRPKIWRALWREPCGMARSFTGDRACRRRVGRPMP